MRIILNTLTNNPISSQEQMNYDIQLVKSLNEGDVILRIYQWLTPTISLGRFQSSDFLNIDKCNKNNIHIVNRPTGGQAVFHHNDLCYSFICHKSLLPESVIDSYFVIAKILVNALKKIGLETQINPFRDKVQNSICFHTKNHFEITYKGKKILGSAQRRLQGKILQQGSLLIESNQHYIHQYEKNFNHENHDNNQKKNITSLSEIFNPIPALEDIIKVYVESFQDYFERNENEI